MTPTMTPCPSSLSLATLASHVGRELGVSSWRHVGQDRIDQFAACTGDHQWLHVDERRAQDEGPFGGTIAHGYLTLAMLAASAFEVFLEPAGIRQVVNYGLDRVRLLSPVRAGSRIRTRIELVGAERRDDGRLLLSTWNTVEVEGCPRPALVAQALLLVGE